MFPDWVKGMEPGCTFPKKCKCTQHKKQRQDSKEITYGIAYGAYPKSISVKINRSLKETKKLFYKHSKAAPKLNRWLTKNAEFTIKNRISYSADIFKRRRTVRDPEEWMVRNVGYNNPVQACAANMTKLAMVSMHEKWHIVFPWHDEIILEVPIKQAKEALKELKGVMEKAADYCTGIPGLIRVEPIITHNLSKDENSKQEKTEAKNGKSTRSRRDTNTKNGKTKKIRSTTISSAQRQKGRTGKTKKV